MLEEYGIPGLPDSPVIGGGLTSQSIGGFTALGRQGSNPQFQNPFVVNPKVNYSKILSRHSLKAGYEYQAINTDIFDFNPQYGSDSYSGQFSRPTTAASNNLYNLADFFFGARSSYSLNNEVVLNYRQRMHFFYFQDDFKFSPQLTLNLGVRYEFATPQWEEQNRICQLRPRDANADPGQGRQHLRSRAGPSGPQQLGAALRPRLSVDAEDGDPFGLRHQLCTLQPAGRREPAGLQRPAHRQRRHQPGGDATALHGRQLFELFPAHAAGLSERA